MSDYRSTYANSYALVVGIDTYTDPRFTPLGQAEADAISFAELLSAEPYNFQVTRLFGAEATKTAILQELHRLRRVNPDDRVLVYFAGHGYTLSDRMHHDTGFLACADTIPDQDFTALKLEDVIELTRHSEAKHIGFIFDACFSGQALGLTRAPAVTADKYLTRRAYQVISAGGGDETVSDYSSMTDSLIESLRGDKLISDGLITMSALGLHLRDVIASDSHQTQIPQFGHLRGSQGGDFVFYIDTSVRLPADLEDALRSSRVSVRRGGVVELINLLTGPIDDALRQVATDRLTAIAESDPDEGVRKLAFNHFEGSGNPDDAQPLPSQLSMSGTLETMLIKGGEGATPIAAPNSNVRRIRVAVGILGVVLIAVLIWLYVSLLFNQARQGDDNENDNQLAAANTSAATATNRVTPTSKPTSDPAPTIESVRDQGTLVTRTEDFPFTDQQTDDRWTPINNQVYKNFRLKFTVDTPGLINGLEAWNLMMVFRYNHTFDPSRSLSFEMYTGSASWSLEADYESNQSELAAGLINIPTEEGSTMNIEIIMYDQAGVIYINSAVQYVEIPPVLDIAGQVYVRAFSTPQSAEYMFRFRDFEFYSLDR